MPIRERTTREMEQPRQQQQRSPIRRSHSDEAAWHVRSPTDARGPAGHFAAAGRELSELTGEISEAAGTRQAGGRGDDVTGEGRTESTRPDDDGTPTGRRVC
jgi:hypothetical protein